MPIHLAEEGASVAVCLDVSHDDAQSLRALLGALTWLEVQLRALLAQRLDVAHGEDYEELHLD